MDFNKETGEFNGEMTDKDVYDVLVKSGIITEEMLSLEEFMILRDLLNAGYSEEEALILAKGYGISEKYRQPMK